MLPYISLLCRRFSSSCPVPAVVHQNGKVLSSEQVVGPNNLIQTIPVIKSIHPSEAFLGVRVSDFSIDNLAAIGALESLKENLHFPSSPLDAANRVGNSLPDPESLVSSDNVESSNPE